MIRDEEANPFGNSISSDDLNAHSHGPDKKHHTLYPRPIKRIDVLREQRVQKEWRAHEQYVEGKKNSDECGSEHHQRSTLPYPLEHGQPKGRLETPLSFRPWPRHSV